MHVSVLTRNAMSAVQAEIRRRRDMETERLRALPEWKRHLLIKRREQDAV